MDRKILKILTAALIIMPLAASGCKGRPENPPETMTEMTEIVGPETNFEPDNRNVTEPAQTVAAETIPPTAMPQIAERRPLPPPMAAPSKDKDIQTALKNAGFYTGAIDGKVGPKTKKAIEDFQRSRGLKVDGKVGPRTWAELEKELIG